MLRHVIVILGLSAALDDLKLKPAVCGLKLRGPLDYTSLQVGVEPAHFLFGLPSFGYVMYYRIEYLLAFDIHRAGVHLHITHLT